MNRITTLFVTVLFSFQLFALTGGPDQYGYIWKDSDEPGGPVYDWIDITGIGTQVTGLADDNIVGPYTMGENFPYYWYGVKKVFIGSNGYITFITSGNISANFPFLPQAGETDNYIAAFMTDLNFAGSGNPGQCWWHDNLDRTVISYINVPYWSATDPNLWTGSNTFQMVLNKLDGSITINYLNVPCCSGSNGPMCGIEAINGDIGLQQNFGVNPINSFSVRFEAPLVPLIDILDASVEWVTDESNGGSSVAVNGSPFELHAFIRNTGNQPLPDFNVTSQIFNATNQLVAVDATSVTNLLPGQAADIIFPNSFVPTIAGTYRSVTTIAGIAGESVVSNNTLTQELVAYDETLLNNAVDWAGATDDGLGIGWTGGQAGCGVYILPASYPSYVSHTTCRIMSNFGNVPFSMVVYDDDGVDGAPGTLLDSVFVDALDGQPGDHEYPLTSPLMLTDGGLYVLWYMNGINVNLAQDIQGPFSLRSYEVIQGAWADYRDREIADFHLGLRMGQVPSPDAGCLTLDQPDEGQQITTSTAVRMWVRNFGNVPLTGIPCNYSFNQSSAVTQNYNGPAIDPGDSVLFMFAQPLVPISNATGPLCVWTEQTNDVDHLNDTTCVNISLTAVSISENSIVRLRLSPVPASSTLRIEGLPSNTLRLEIFDMTGAMRSAHSLQRVGGIAQIPVYDLAEGAYVLRVITDGASVTERFVVQR
ncbi:MAG: T9SS type A sorting domain-containing protein [Flavobacteriales bacterium]|nr:T9SS type A sorting domain-containing protein [Flavobacteriales bacterium]